MKTANRSDGFLPDLGKLSFSSGTKAQPNNCKCMMQLNKHGDKKREIVCSITR